MGKAALILVLATVMAASITMLSINRSSIETSAQEADYDGRTLARSYAESALNLAVRHTSANFASYRVNLPKVKYREGSYDLAVTGPSSGPVVIKVVGRYGDFTYTITGRMEQSSERKIDALTVLAPVKKFDLKDTAKISGLDTKPDGSDGSAVDVHAVLGLIPSGYTFMKSKATAGHAPGVAGDPDVTNVLGTSAVSSILSELATYNGAGVTVYSKDQVFKNVTLGSPSNPVVLQVDGDVKLQDNVVGYGVIWASGNFVMEKNAKWEGLVYAVDNGGKHYFNDTAALYGAAIFESVAAGGGTSTDAGLPGGHFDIDVFKDATAAEVYHQHMYDDKYKTATIDLLAAGCKSGKLCWSTVMAGSTAVFLEMRNVSASWGDYTIKTNGTSPYSFPAATYIGTTSNGFSTTTPLDVRALTDLKITFKSLCSMRPTKPSKVQSDASSRDGAFTLRAYQANWSGSGWTKGAMKYEISAYHHDESATQCSPGTTDPSGPAPVGKEMEMTMEKTSRIVFSSDALRRLRTIIPSLELLTGDSRLTNVTESVSTAH